MHTEKKNRTVHEILYTTHKKKRKKKFKKKTAFIVQFPDVTLIVVLKKDMLALNEFVFIISLDVTFVL